MYFERKSFARSWGAHVIVSFVEYTIDTSGLAYINSQQHYFIVLSITMIDLIVAFLSGSSPYHAELRTFGQAFMGALTVRSGANKNKDMNWFHAFALTTISAFGGGWFGFIWMGKPTSLITNGDVTLTLTAIAFVLLTYTPMNVGYMFGKMLPVKILLNSWAQLFRGLGMIGFINACAAEVSPSKYYPTAVLGPVVYGTLLGNMGAFFQKGFHNHLEKDIPWAFQNGE